MLLVHVPPMTLSDKFVVNPTHTFAIPFTLVGITFTVTTVSVTQPSPSVYVIVAVPAATPFTEPENEITEAIRLNDTVAVYNF